MSTPDIRVRLSPEGIQEVISAFKRIQSESSAAARTATRNTSLLTGALRELKTLLPAIGVTALAGGLLALSRNALKTADNVGKIGEKTGTTAEAVSVLLNLFAGADLTGQDLQATLTQLTKSLGNLQAGAQKETDAFAKLNLTARDFDGLDTAQAFDLIAKRMALLQDSSAKTDIALDIFKNADLIPALNKLGTEGFGELARQAEASGLLITSAQAQAAAATNDAVTAMKQQVVGLANQFVQGLLPDIQAVMFGFQNEVSGKGVEPVRAFGAEVGRVLRTVIATFRLMFVTVRDLIGGLANQIGGFAALLNARTFADISSIWKQLGEEGDRDFESFKRNFKDNLANIVDEATREQPALIVPVKPEVDQAAARAAAAQLAKVQGEISGRDAAKKAAEEGKKAAKELADAQKKSAEELIDLEQKLLGLRGQSREQQLALLDEEIRKYEETFRKAGQLTDEVLAKLAEFRARSTVRIDFDIASDRITAELASLANQRERIEQDVQLGTTTRRGGREQILAIEQERLALLKELVAEQLRLAEASGDPTLVNEAQRMNNEVRSLEVSVRKASDAWVQFKEAAREGVESDISNAIFDIATGVESLSDGIKKLGDAILDTLVRIASQKLAEGLADALFGTGAAPAAGGGGGSQSLLGVVGAFFGGLFAQGGLIPKRAGGGTIDATPGGRLSGPGTGTSDNLLAWVSPSEFVTRAAVVRQPGMLGLLQRINAGQLTSDMAARSFASLRGLPRFARGGLVGQTGGMTSAGDRPLIGTLQQTIQAPNAEVGRQTAKQAGSAALRALQGAQRSNG